METTLLSFTPQHLRVLEQLAANPHVAVTIQRGELKTFSKLVSRDMYHVEDLIKDVHGVEIGVGKGDGEPVIRVRSLACGYREIWSSADDAFGSVYANLIANLSAQTAEGARFRSKLDGAYGHHHYVDLLDMVDHDSVRNNLVPYAKDHARPTHTELNNAVLGVQGLDDVRTCCTSLRWKWVRYVTALRATYSHLRGLEVTPPLRVVPSGVPTDATTKTSKPPNNLQNVHKLTWQNGLST